MPDAQHDDIINESSLNAMQLECKLHHIRRAFVEIAIALRVRHGDFLSYLESVVSTSVLLVTITWRMWISGSEGLQGGSQAEVGDQRRLEKEDRDEMGLRKSTSDGCRIDACKREGRGGADRSGFARKILKMDVVSIIIVSKRRLVSSTERSEQS